MKETGEGGKKGKTSEKVTFTRRCFRSLLLSMNLHRSMRSWWTFSRAYDRSGWKAGNSGHPQRRQRDLREASTSGGDESFCSSASRHEQLERKIVSREALVAATAFLERQLAFPSSGSPGLLFVDSGQNRSKTQVRGRLAGLVSSKPCPSNRLRLLKDASFSPVRDCHLFTDWHRSLDLFAGKI